MNNFEKRTAALVGEENIKKVKESRIAVCGLGGVGGFCLEALVRSGFENIILIDPEVFDETNLNRQILSSIEFIGKYKVDAAYKRALNINRKVNLKKYYEKISEGNIENFGFETCDYVVDAIDDLPAKISIIKYCKEKNVKIISAMGAGKRLDITKLKVEDIYKTKNCPLARKMRSLLKKENIKNLKVAYSEEIPIKTERHDFVESAVFVPVAMGILLAQEVFKAIIE